MAHDANNPVSNCSLEQFQNRILLMNKWMGQLSNQKDDYAGREVANTVRAEINKMRDMGMFPNDYPKMTDKLNEIDVALYKCRMNKAKTLVHHVIKMYVGARRKLVGDI